MRKKYEFQSKEQADSLLPFYHQGRCGTKLLAGARGFVELGHIQLAPPVMDGDEQIEAATFSTKWAVDVDWRQDPPANLSDFEVTPNNPVHKFS
jgi:hypothetical protein